MTARRPVARLAAILGLAAVALFAPLAPAEAHRLKLFVTVEDGEIGGYAFFIGGGRPEGVDVVVEDGEGGQVHRGKTDDQGRFRWRPTRPADYSVTIDAGDGHRVTGAVSADRLTTAIAAPPLTTAAPTPPASTPPASAPAPDPAPTAPAAACPAPIDPAALARLVEARVDAALARQLRPLIEAQTQAEGRLRLNDVMGGVGMIVGLAGAALWAMARRRDRREDHS